MSCQERHAECWGFSGKRKSKERSRELWEQGNKGLLKELLVGWKAALAAEAGHPGPSSSGPSWAIQPQGWPCTPAFPSQAVCSGEGGVGAQGTSFPGLEGQQSWAQGPGQREHVWLWWERLHLVLGRSWDRAERCGASLGCAAISAQVPGASSLQL